MAKRLVASAVAIIALGVVAFVGLGMPVIPN